MYYKLKSNILFRNYKTYGYITDDRNYRYIKDRLVGDRVVSESGAVFLSSLTKNPKSINEICSSIEKKYPDIDRILIKNDVEEFFTSLVNDGFICKGVSANECNNNDYVFSYKKRSNEILAHDHDSDFFNTVEFLEKNDQEKYRLNSVHIEITSKCNERCIHCYIPHGNKIKTLDIKHIYSILEQCRDMNVMHIVLSGGEPMLYKDFIGILKKCREYDFAVSVLTNLTLLTNNIIEEMCLNGLLGVQTSLYSMDSVIHDSITKMTGSFDKTKTAILKLIDNDIPLQISCPIMKQNQDSYNSVLEWAANQGVVASEDFTLIAEYDHSNHNITNRLSLDEVRCILNRKALDETYQKR